MISCIASCRHGGLCYQFYHYRFYQFGSDNSVIGLMSFVPITQSRALTESRIHQAQEPQVIFRLEAQSSSGLIP